MIQIGNEIPPIFAELLAKQLINCDSNKLSKEPAGLISYSVTKASAKSPALAKTCELLNNLMNTRFTQLELGVN
jgi:hypothetical protein